MRLSLIPVCFFVWIAMPTLALAATYKWVDEQGVTHYGDKIPPQYAKQQREVVNDQGTTVKVLQKEKTPEERAAEQAAKLEQERLKQAEQKQAAYDRYLVQTFESEADLARMRDERLATMDSHIKINETAAAGTQKSLDQLKAREAKGKTPQLTKQITELEARLAKDQQTLTKQRDERARLSAQFTRDIARYRQLKGPAPSASNQ
jgi:hypothetical protein